MKYRIFSTFLYGQNSINQLSSLWFAKRKQKQQHVDFGGIRNNIVFAIAY